MDPTECYLAMFAAMRDGNLGQAQEHAEALRDWLERGGFYPPNYAKEAVVGYLCSVCRRLGMRVPKLS